MLDVNVNYTSSIILLTNINIYSTHKMMETKLNKSHHPIVEFHNLLFLVVCLEYLKSNTF